jgi:hypothetical protein
VRLCLAGWLRGLYGQRHVTPGSSTLYCHAGGTHHHKSFREELIEMLDKAEIEYDQKYLD